MSSLTLSSSNDEDVLSSKVNLRFSTLSLTPGGQKTTQLVYFNHEENFEKAIEAIFQNKIFDVPSPKLIIVLEGGLLNSSERLNDFNEKQFSTLVARLILDIGRNKLCNASGGPWLFCKLRHDSVAGRIVHLTRKLYLANDIPLSKFVTIGLDVCPSVPLKDAPHDYQSLVDVLSNGYEDSSKIEPVNHACTNAGRILNKRLLRGILYGRKEQDLTDQCTLLQRCVEEIGRIQDHDKTESVSIPKIILLYGGDLNNVQTIYRLLNTDFDRKKFGLVIIRGSGGLADILAWVCDKIRSGGTCLQIFEGKILTKTFLRELKVLVNQLLGYNLTHDLIRLITFLAINRCKKVRVCDEEDDLSMYLLEALVSENQNQRLSSLKLQLSLAFDLNQPKFASRMLRANQDMLEEDLIQLAKMAIIRDQIEFLRVLEDTCGITSDNFGEYFEYELSSNMNYNHDLFVEFVHKNLGCNLDDVYRSPDENAETVEDEKQSINVKLFLWAIFFDHYNLSLHFWRRLNDRLCGALIATLVYRRTVDLSIKQNSVEQVNVQRLQDHANKYENLALRLLESLYLSNPNMTRLALKRENFEFNKFSLLEVAMMSHCENFVAHTSVQEVFDGIWTGETYQKVNGEYVEQMQTNDSSKCHCMKTNFQSNTQKGSLKFMLTIKNKLARPKVKYQFHLLFYMLFLSLLSYSTLFGKVSSPQRIDSCSNNHTLCETIYSSKNSWSYFKLFVNTWVFMFALEEFRQIKFFKTKHNNIRQTLMLYLDESWNKLDCLCIITYIVSIMMEIYNTKSTLNAARAFLALDVVLWFIRLLTLFMIDRTVGPILLMIQAMLNDMMTFFSIFFVFTTAYGVASFSLLHNGELLFDVTIFRKIFHAAYWHVFGHINDLDAVKDNFELTGWAAFLLLVFYMAVCNIILVNLLVAMFSNTFDRMYARMDTLWKFHRYHVIKEYVIVASLPPPLNLFSRGNNDLKPFNPELSSEQITNLRRREALAFETDAFEQATKEQQSNYNRQEKLDLELRQLRKMIANVKVTCEASTMDD